QGCRHGCRGIVQGGTKVLGRKYLRLGQGIDPRRRRIGVRGPVPYGLRVDVSAGERCRRGASTRRRRGHRPGTRIDCFARVGRSHSPFRFVRRFVHGGAEAKNTPCPPGGAASEVLRTRGTSALRLRLLSESGASGRGGAETPIFPRPPAAGSTIPR